MAIPLEPAHWFEEREAATQYRDQFLDDWSRVITHYHGPGHRSGRTDDATHDPENHAFEWLGIVASQMTASNPRAGVRTSRMGAARKGAVAQQFSLNRWIELVDMQSTNEKLAVDYGLKWAVSAVFPKPQPGMTETGDPMSWPSMRRISPRRYLQDPKAIEFEEQRWRSHLVIEDKNDLLERAREKPKERWNVKEIENLPTGIGVNEARGHSDGAYQYDSLDRGELAYQVFWVPEYQPDPKKGPDQGYNGALLTLGIGSAYDTGSKDQAVWLKPPIPYFGPRWGPYQVCGAYVVPDDATPLSPIAATQPQAEHLNAIARAIQRAIEDYKRIALVSNGDPDLETIVAEGQHGFVYATNVDDLNKNVVQLELGGLTQQFLAAEERARQSLDRNTGLPDAMRGNVEGGATATEVNAAMMGGGIRVMHHIDKFRRFLARNLKTVAWYLEWDNSIEPFALGPDAIAAMENEFGEKMEEFWVGPGKGPDQNFDDFDDYDFRIELYSMERTSEQQQLALAQELDFMVGTIGPMMSDPTMQHVRWPDYLQTRGQLRGVTSYGRLFDLTAAADIAEKMMGVQIQKGGTATMPQPRLARDMAGTRKTNSGINGLNHREPKSTMPSRDLARSNGSAK